MQPAAPEASPATPTPGAPRRPRRPLWIRARPLETPLALRIHVPRFIGDVGRNTRSMWWKRAGRPRSAMSSTALPASPTADNQWAVRTSGASAGRRDRLAAAASAADAPATPPR